MVRNIELKTTTMLVPDATASLTVGGQVPSGMKRWVTFLQVRAATSTGSAVGLHIASVPVSNPTVASIVATTNRKHVIHVRASKVGGGELGGTVNMPHTPNVNCPLFSIGEGKWCGVVASVLTAMIFAQYFDE